MNTATYNTPALVAHARTNVINPHDLPTQYILPAAFLSPTVAAGANGDDQVLTTDGLPKKGDVVAVWRKPETLGPEEPYVSLFRIDFDLPENWQVTDRSKARTNADMIIVFKTVTKDKAYLYRASEIEAIHRWVGIRPKGERLPVPTVPAPDAQSAVIVRRFDGHDMRIVERDGEYWFVASDVAGRLGYDHTPHLTRNLDDDEKGVHSLDTPGGQQNVTLVSEPGLYRAIIQRRATRNMLPALVESISRFQRWVFHDVLPSIRKTGGYSIQQPTAPQLPDFTNPVAAARAWADATEAKQIAEQRALTAERTKAEIGTRREATAMNTASQAVKKANKLEIELDRSLAYATVKRMQEVYGKQNKFDWRVLKQESANLGLPPVPVPDQNYGKVNAYHVEVWKKAYDVAIPRFDKVA